MPNYFFLLDLFFSLEHETPLDLGILIDASDTVDAKNWTKMKALVSSIVASFKMSSSETHVGIVVFSRDAEIPLYFNTLQENNLTKENVQKVLDKLKPMQGSSRFDVAMQLTEEELFNEANGMRIEIPKVRNVLFGRIMFCTRKT